MNRATRTLIIASAMLLGPPLFAYAQAAEPATHNHEHSSAAASAPATNSATAMQHMQRMHDKMMAAATPAERKALMAEHMQAMQEAMSAMQHMTPGQTHGGISQDAMHQHMDMTTMMMQMMMDREQMCGDMMSGTRSDTPDHSHAAERKGTPPKP